MATELEMRHKERELLFDLMRAEKEGSVPILIQKLQTSMEQEDVKLVEQRIAKLYNE